MHSYKQVKKLAGSLSQLLGFPPLAALACTLVPPSACQREKQKAQAVTLKIGFLNPSTLCYAPAHPEGKKGWKREILCVPREQPKAYETWEWRQAGFPLLGLVY